MGQPVIRTTQDTAGGIIQTSNNTTVIVNGCPVAVKGDPVVPHGKPPHVSAVMVDCSVTVFAEGIGVCRLNDKASCGHKASPGSSDVSAG